VFSTLSKLVPFDPAFPERTHRLDVLGRVLNGTLYDLLPYSFDEERDGNGEYIPLRRRAPSVRSNLARVVVEDSVALLFSEGHFPIVDSADGLVAAALTRLSSDTNLKAVMTEAALRGSVGSVAILMRLLSGRIFLDVLDTLFLSPCWNPEAPDQLASVVERYKVSGRDLERQGYTIDQPDGTYWFCRRWDTEFETWFLPEPVGSTSVLPVDESRTVRHGLGFVPLVWIKNLPGGKGIDGAATFWAALDTIVEIDYQLSQAGRGLKYSSDPTLLIKEPAGLDGTMVRGAANALVVSEKGDAKLLEIGGTASEAVIQYVRALREMALESMHGNRADPSRLTVPASGRALELMNQGLVWLADNLRISYGSGLAALARMMLRAARVYHLTLGDVASDNLPEDTPVSLRWPDWYPADAGDRLAEANRVMGLVLGKHISRQTGLRILAPSCGIDNVQDELDRILAEDA
jgi:hypothetical protein